MPDPYGLTHVVAALPVTRRAWGQVWGQLPGVAFGGSTVSARPSPQASWIRGDGDGVLSPPYRVPAAAPDSMGF